MYKGKVVVRFADCDPGGIVFFANYYKFAHQIFEDFLLTFMNYNDYFKDKSIAFPLIKSEAKYRTPSFAGETLDVELTVESVSDHAFSVKYDFQKEGIICATVKTVHVAVSIESIKKTEIPALIKENLRKHLNQE